MTGRRIALIGGGVSGITAGHYDLPAAFYQLILDPSMAYSCARWDGTGPETPDLATAQSRAWLDNFERNLPAITRLLAAEQVRVWRLYLADGALAFEQGRMGIDQILAVRPER